MAMTKTQNDYETFLDAKKHSVPISGFAVDPSTINPMAYPFQRDIIRWAIARGKSAICTDCGMGKSLKGLDVAKAVTNHIDRPALILAPLAVSMQMVNEGAKFGIEVTPCREQSAATGRINITNYDMVHHFDPAEFGCVILDESSCIKAHDGKFRQLLTDMFAQTPFRYSLTATPAPNDYMELGNQAEFLGIMTRIEMLATFFTHDGGDTAKWRLKGHAEYKFWEWLASWMVMIQKPSDLGYDDDGFILPARHIHHHVLDANMDEVWDSGLLLPAEAKDLHERRAARRSTIESRCAAVAEMVNASDEPWLIWCNLNDEGDTVTKLIPGAVQVTGSDSREFKENSLMGFTRGDFRVMVSKPKIAGYGMNWQHCSNIAFVGLSDSWEDWYQSIRRCWRFGQKNEVNIHVFTSEMDGAVVANIERKEKQAEEMMRKMVEHMKDISAEVIHESQTRERDVYETDTATGNGWTWHLGDCVTGVGLLEPESIGYTIFSPPFNSLYTYSNSERDMGNARNTTEFFEHFRFLAGLLYRATMPGRLMSFHCMDLPRSKERDGVIGLWDFPGDLTRIFSEIGFIYHSKVCIWKDPVTAMQRTKAIGLLHKQIKKDSALSRQGIADYIITMRKPGVNTVPITHTPDDLPVSVWQNYASPVWMDINPNDTLQRQSARENADERHICPLQLEVIRRCIHLWSLPGDLVLSPFGGIASEGYEAVRAKRRFVGFELKKSYWKCGIGNLKSAENAGNQSNLFDLFDDSGENLAAFNDVVEEDDLCIA